MSHKALVIYDKPELFRADLEARFGDVSFTFATDGPAVLEALDEEPQIVFSIKHSGFPAGQHRPAVDCPSVKWLQVGGSGYDHFLPWDGSRLKVTNCAGLLAPFLAETALGAMIALNGNFPTYHRQQDQKIWQPIAFQPLMGKRLLIVGLGAIGGELATRAKALGMEIHAIRRKQEPHPSVDVLHPPTAIDELLPDCDLVSLHLRYAQETHHFMSDERFSRMKPGSLFLNTSRGGVVDTQALLKALDEGPLRAAYLDVFEEEPLPAASPVWAHPKVMMTPHASDNVSDWPIRFAGFFADNLERWLTGQALMNEVRP